MFGKCWDRIQADGRFVICEYSWLDQDRTGQFAHIFDEMYGSIHSRYHDYQIEQEIKDIEKFETDLNKNNNKKKKKKPKKKGQSQLKEEKQQKADYSDNQQNKASQLNRKQEPKQQITEKIKSNVEDSKQELIRSCDKSQNKPEQEDKFTEEIIDVEKKSKKSEKSNIKTPKKQSLGSNQEISSDQIKKSHKKNEPRTKCTLQSQQIQSLSEQKSDSFTDSTCKLQTISRKKQESEDKQIQKQQQRHTTKTKQYEQYYANDKTSEMSQQSQLSADYFKFKPKSKSLSKPSIVGVSMKKIQKKVQQADKKQKQLESIMGTALQNHAKFLMEESEKFQQTRKAAVDLIKDFLNHQDIKCKWELIMFGSCEVGYALKQSDIDLVLRIQDPKIYSLKDVQSSLKFFPWALDCQYISTANVPIITLKINLYEAKKLSNRMLKKLDKCHLEKENIWQYAEDFLVTVDISMCGLKQQYGGIVSSNHLRFLFYENQPLKKIIFILKDILRRKQLNKPYRGGVNSYVLAMMTYGIIKKKELQLTKINKTQNEYVLKKRKDFLEGLKSNLYIAFCQITNYLKDFIAFETLINPLEDKLEPQPSIHLNIIDPFSKKLVKTSAFKINEIIEQFQSFRIFLDHTRDQIKSVDIENNKKLKFQVCEKIAEYIADLQPQMSLSKGKSSEDLLKFIGKN